MIHMIEEINERKGILPNITLGSQGFGPVSASPRLCKWLRNSLQGRKQTSPTSETVLEHFPQDLLEQVDHPHRLLQEFLGCVIYLRYLRLLC